MKNPNIISYISCPYCGEVALKFIPKECNFAEFYDHDAFCSECGRHSIDFIKHTNPKEAA